MKFPPEFNEKVDLKKVKFDLIKSWISKRIGELLGFEDDVVINFVISSLEAEVTRNSDSPSPCFV
jgi:serine/arginine repetitive matrix protein 1